MRLATYNIWNSALGMPKRQMQIVNEIKSIDADILGLQEVENKERHELLKLQTGYEYDCFVAHEGYEEGLSIFSKYPIKFFKYLDSTLITVIEQLNKKILIVNVHLPYNSVKAKEKCMVDLINEISSIDADYRFIVGDFNASKTSSVYQFLSGDRTLLNTEVKVYWTDLSRVAEEYLNIESENTLDLMNNPRWKGQRITDVSSKVDYIFIHDCYPNEYPELRELVYFGKAIDDESGYCASDHYGIVADLKMPYE